MDISAIVNVQISLSASSVSQKGFGTLHIMGKSGRFAAETARVYTSLSAMAADWAGHLTDPEYLLAQAYFSANPAPLKVLVSQVTDAAPVDALNKLIAAGYTDWFGLMLGYAASDADFENVAAWNEALKSQRLLGVPTAAAGALDPAGTADVAYILKGSGYNWTFTMYDDSATLGTDVAAWFGRMLPTLAGKAAWVNKVLKGQTPSGLSDTAVGALDGKNCNYYISVSNQPLTRKGVTCSGIAIEDMVGIAWLQSIIQQDTLSMMATTDKISFTDDGIASVCASIDGDLKLGVTQQVINAGYSLPVPAASDYTSAQRQSHFLNGLTFTAQKTSSIGTIQINGSLSY